MEGNLPQYEVFWSGMNTRTEVRLVCRGRLTKRIVARSMSLFSVWTLGLPVMSITVGVTVVVPGQVRVRPHLGRAGHALTLAQTIFVPFPVKVLHISHVQSIGRVVEVKLDDSILLVKYQRDANTSEL